MSDRFHCPSCNSSNLHPFYELKRVPAHSVLLLRKFDEAVSYPSGNISLGFCQTCGFICNLAFDPSLHEYSSQYEETQGFSPTFNAFHHRLADYLIGRYDLRRKTILEIGCGKGEFLVLLCEKGKNQGIGFDPAYVSGRLESEALGRITFIDDFYSEKYAEYAADFICCKMTLEHIQHTADFVSTIRRSIGDRSHTIVFFQVPDVVRILEEIAFWDIYYEHCSYFSPGSLGRLFRRCGFEVLDLWKDYDDQYLMIEARPGNGHLTSPLEQEDDLDVLRGAVEQFSQEYTHKLDTWKDRMQELKQQGLRVVLWGGGSKGVTFLTTLKIKDEIGYAVDINPFKRDTFMAGTGHRIISPEQLQAYRSDVVIIMNPIYRDEIEKSLAKMDLFPTLMSVLD